MEKLITDDIALSIMQEEEIPNDWTIEDFDDLFESEHDDLSWTSQNPYYDDRLDWDQQCAEFY